jgi:hypothetical protein
MLCAWSAGTWCCPFSPICLITSISDFVVMFKRKQHFQLMVFYGYKIMVHTQDKYIVVHYTKTVLYTTHKWIHCCTLHKHGKDSDVVVCINMFLLRLLSCGVPMSRCDYWFPVTLLSTRWCEEVLGTLLHQFHKMGQKNWWERWWT